MSPQLKAGLIRGIVGGVIASMIATIAWLATQPQYAVPAAIAGAFLSRFLVEGGFDQYRNQNNITSNADVSKT